MDRKMHHRLSGQYTTRNRKHTIEKEEVPGEVRGAKII